MNSALKPVGVPPSPVPQLNKPTPTTYNQPLNHIPQNLSNLPHSTPTPANAHSNNVNTTNHYPLNSTSLHNSGSSPPPSNHPIANTNQSLPTKNITHNSNTNNVHSYKVPALTVSENISDPLSLESDVALPEQPQSNGASAEKTILEQESINNGAESSLKPLPVSQPVNVPESLVVTTEKTSETVKVVTTPEKPVEVEVSAPEQVAQNPDVVEATVPEVVAVLPSKPTDVPKTSTPAVSEPVASTTESVPPVPATPATPNEDSPQVDKVTPTTSTEAPVATVTSDVKQAITTSSPAAAIPQEQTTKQPTSKPSTAPRTPIPKNKPTINDSPDQAKINKVEVKTPTQKSPSSIGKAKRTRIRTQPYQSPLPEVEMISKISASASTPKSKNVDDKLTVFYKNEFLAVRNPEGGFYLCQAVHNVYKSTRKLRILWLSQDKNDGDIYSPDFYDQTDFDCILTNINLTRVSKGKFKLPDKERIRTDNILKRALAVEKGDATPPCPTEAHPDGLDLSLYKEESQLKKGKGKKRKASPTKSKKSNTGLAPDQPKVRKVDPKPKPPPVSKALLIKKTLGVKAKETAVTNLNRPTRTKAADSEVATVTKTAPAVEQKKDKAVTKIVKKPAPPTSPTQPSSSKQLPPRRQSLKQTDTVVPFLKKDPPTLKKEAPPKKEFLVLKKESSLKKQVSPKGTQKEVPAVKKEMPVLKKEAPVVKKEVPVQKQVVTRKSSRGKK